MSKQKQYRDEEAIQKLGQKIRECRIKKGLSQEELANECNLEISQINRIELGKINTSVSHIFLIAEHLEIEAYELLKF